MVNNTGLQFTVNVDSLPESTFSVVDFQLDEELDNQRESYQHYDYPGRFKKDLSGHRLDAQRADAVTGQGSSNSGALMPGSEFTLTEHPNLSIFQTNVSLAESQRAAVGSSSEAQDITTGSSRVSPFTLFP